MTTDVQSAWTRPPEWLPDQDRSVTDHRIGTREEWAAAREELLVREKEHTRLGDELARQRRELPWVRVEKDYRLDTDDGPRALADLFDGRSQLLIYHFMFGPSYQAGCPINSSIADSIDGARPPPERARRDDAPRVAGPTREAAGVQAAHGLEHPVGLIGRQRLQRRPRVLEQRGDDAGVGRRRTASPCRRSSTATPARAAPMSPATSPRARASAPSSWMTGSSTRRMRPGGGARVPDGLLPDPRPGAEGPRRGRGFQLWLRRHDEYASGVVATTKT